MIPYPESERGADGRGPGSRVRVQGKKLFIENWELKIGN